MSTQPTLITERNRANAQRSTGPKTPAGKAISAQNARKHGFFVSDATVEQENPEEFAGIYAEYVADYRPHPGIETELVRQLAVATQRLRRLERFETVALTRAEAAATRHQASAIMEQAFVENWTTIEKIIRARAAAERSFHRVYQELETRKRARTVSRPAPRVVEFELDTRHRPQNEPTPPAPEPENTPFQLRR